MNDKTKATEFECPKCGSIHYTGKLGRQFRIPDGGASRAEAPTNTPDEPVLSQSDLEELDRLQVTHPNLFRYIRELGQAVIALTEKTQ